MKIFKVLTQAAPARVFVSLLLGTFAGIGYAFLVPIVLNSFSDAGEFAPLRQGPVELLSWEVSHYRFAVLFFVMCIVIIATRTWSQLLLSWVAIDATSDMRIRYYKAIVDAPTANLEKVGASRLIASITTDVRAIVQGAQRLPDLLISLVTVVGMMLFLLYLNDAIFFFVCKALFIGVVTFQIPMLFGKRFFRRARNKVDELQEAIRGNIYGAKELKLCESRRADYLTEVLSKIEDDVRAANKRGLTILRSTMNYGDMISFFVIGVVAFVFINYHSVTQDELVGAIMVLLYIAAPISMVLGAVPDVVSANISLAKVETLFSDLPVEDIDAHVATLAPWRQVRFSNVTYRYTNATAADGFTVGPLSFVVSKGQATFIVGGNGSGKSTLGKLITSHYLPHSGQVHLDGRVLDRTLVNGFRNQVSAIWTDYYLFDRLLGASKKSNTAVIEKYLERLQLHQKVNLRAGRFSTLSLSDGQRKRLALLIAFLEDKELYVFDEWAADQDPEFKQVFYYELLPYLKHRDKAVVVISHDDRYFDVADRILVMESGVLSERRADAVREFLPSSPVSVLPSSPGRRGTEVQC